MEMARREAVGAHPIPDADLIRRVEAGDQQAFTILYERYFPRVYRFVRRRLDNPADTEETVQEAFTNVFTSISGFRGEAPFEAWVLGLTRRIIARRFKKKRHPTVPLDDQDGDPFDPLLQTTQRQPTPLESFEYRERVETLRTRAERELTPVQRELFVRHHLDDQPVREIALVMRKSEDSIKSNLYRVRKLLFAS